MVLARGAGSVAQPAEGFRVTTAKCWDPRRPKRRESAASPRPTARLARMARTGRSGRQRLERRFEDIKRAIIQVMHRVARKSSKRRAFM
jgi:hypothetical protein